MQLGGGEETRQRFLNSTARGIRNLTIFFRKEKTMKETELKKRLWELVRAEGIIITNQNIDWLISRVYKGANDERAD